MVGGSCVAKEVDDGMSDIHSEVSAFGFLDHDQMSKMASCCSTLVQRNSLVCILEFCVSSCQN